MKIFWVSTALIVLLCGVAVSRPEVRNVIDRQFPALGINGKGPRSGAVVADGSMDFENTPRLVNIDSQDAAINSAPGFDNAQSFQLGDAATNDQLAIPQLPTNPTSTPLPNAAAFPTLPGAPSQTLNPLGSAIPTPAQLPSSSLDTARPQIGQEYNSYRTQDGRLVARAATLDFVRKIDVVAQADGILTELFVDEGSYVKANTPLLEQDSRIAVAEVMVQTRELEQAQLKADNVAQIEFAKAAYDKAKVELEISEELFRKNAEDASSARAKQLEKKKAELQIDVSEIEHAQEKAAVSVSQAKLDAANVQIALRKVVAPWDGFVTDLAKHRFSYVRAGEVVFTLCDLTKMRVKGSVSADIPPHLLYGAPASVRISIAPGVEREITGKIGYVPYETKSGTDYPVWVEINNEQLPDGQFLYRKGMKATLIITPPNQ